VTHRILSWDYREQPALDALAAVVWDVLHGAVHLYKVATGSDDVAVVLSDRPLRAAEVDTIWEREEVGDVSD
jgi:hypothetical protein